MLSYTIRRCLVALPTLLGISIVVFALLDFAPGDPMAELPLTISPEVRADMRTALGLDAPAPERFARWLWQFTVIEPGAWIDRRFGTDYVAGAPRVLSWQTRAPVMDLVADRLPQTLWVVGVGFLLGSVLALPLAVLAAAPRGGLADHAATGVGLIGLAVPPIFSAVLLIAVFTLWLDWLPSVYDTTLRVTGWDSLGAQLRQMALPVAVVTIQVAAQVSRYARAAMIDAMSADHIRAARARGMSEARVLIAHGLRNALIPVVSVIAVGLPQVFGGAIVTETVFRVNGIGQLLVASIRAGDLPTVQTVTMLLAVLIVVCNLLADLTYGALDPRIRHG